MVTQLIGEVPSEGGRYITVWALRRCQDAVDGVNLEPLLVTMVE